MTPLTSHARRPDRGRLPKRQPAAGKSCVWESLGRLPYRQAWDVQLEWVERIKAGRREDRLLLVEHPHVVTLGRNARAENVLASPERLAQLGIELHETDRGGDVTYHGPGQIVGYPIIDLADWKKDVAAYLRALEEVLIRTLAEYGITGRRIDGVTGVWVDDAKIAALGVHISRWVSSHGFALNLTTDLDYFGHIVPCGLTRPVTSIERLLGQAPGTAEIQAAIVRRFGDVFERRMLATSEGELNSHA
jgi:lipoyl(octanoyl) transferase